MTRPGGLLPGALTTDETLPSGHVTLSLTVGSSADPVNDHPEWEAWLLRRGRGMSSAYRAARHYHPESSSGKISVNERRTDYQEHVLWIPRGETTA